MNYLSQNVKYLLLEKGIKRSEWRQTLATSLRCGQERAQAILEGEASDLSEDEKEGLTRFSGMASEKVISQDLLRTNKVDIFSRNLSFLLDRVPHGKKKHLAANLGVDPTTISRWGNGTQQPTKRKIAAILDYFSLPRTTDLMNEPLFLSTMPIGEDGMKKWLKEKIDELDRETLRELAPALIMLLKRR
jgi:transcriptional regulator with XRE-family HTH domain